MHCSERLCKDVAQLLPAIDLRAWRPASLLLPMIVEKIQIFLVLLGIVSVLAVVAEQVRFPFPILCVIAGLLIGLVPNFRMRSLIRKLSSSSSFRRCSFRRHGISLGMTFARTLCQSLPWLSV